MKKIDKCIEVCESGIKCKIKSLKEEFGDEIFISDDIPSEETINVQDLNLKGFSRGGYLAVLLANKFGKNLSEGLNGSKVIVCAIEPLHLVTHHSIDAYGKNRYI